MVKRADQDEIEIILQRELDILEREIAEGEAALEPKRDRARKIRSMLNEYHSGSMRSTGLTDEEIVAAIVKLGARSEQNVVRTPEIAAALGVDGRGISKRLPRMAESGMISGSPESGYWVADGRRR